MAFKARVKRLGGTPLERRLRAAESDLKSAQYARDRALGQYLATKEQYERREADLAEALARVAALKGTVH